MPKGTITLILNTIPESEPFKVKVKVMADPAAKKEIPKSQAKETANKTSGAEASSDQVA